MNTSTVLHDKGTRADSPHDRTQPPSTVLTVVLPDRFDVHQLATFETRMLETFADVRLDMGEVRFVDQHALRSLVKARADAIASGHDVYVGSMSTAARITLELTGLVEAIPSARDRAEVA